MKTFEKLSSKKVFKFFREISDIPRGSGNEKQISDYLVHFAKERNLEYYQDELFNIVIKKPASLGYENIPSIALQGHLDMVCEKNKAISHDFLTDPIKWNVKNDLIYANGTTLGADNGIAVAMGMAILDSNNLKHPAIELILTVQEETGLTGAKFLDKALINSKTLINIDAENEGEFLISCAGGIKSDIVLPIEKTFLETEYDTFIISVTGLQGGHSGTQIHLGRGNAICILGRVLYDIQRFLKYEIFDIYGGSKDNVIPREAFAKIAIKKGEAEILAKLLDDWNDILKNEYKIKDENINISLEQLENDSHKVLNMVSKENLLYILNIHPNGVDSMSSEIPGLVQTSINLGVLHPENSHIHFKSLIRSSVASKKYNLTHKLRLISAHTQSVIYITDDYSEWKFNSNSKIQKLFAERYKHLYKKKARLTAVHMAVECGVFEEKLGDIDMISFGPNIYDIHSPNEHLSISSVDNCYKLLLDVLEHAHSLI
ncbi:MAG: aminoacyl-histidine dipeptidase [Proteocatella sp.]